MDLELKGKRAFISGSTKGIGFAIAKTLVKEGAEVIINGRSKSTVDDALKRIKETINDAEVTGVACDFSSPEEVKSLIENVGEVDILINNVGIFEPKPFEEIADDEWQKFYDINVMSGVRLSRAFLPAMKRKNWGRIIFISSESSINIPVEMVHYGMTKTAQLAISRGIAETTKGTIALTLTIPIFQQGIDSGELKDGCSQTYAEILLGIIHHHIFMVNMKLIELDKKKAEQIFDVFFNGVKS